MAIPSISQLFRAFEPFVLYQREIEANKTEFQIYSLETFRRKFQILKWIKDRKKRKKERNSKFKLYWCGWDQRITGWKQSFVGKCKKKKKMFEWPRISFSNASEERERREIKYERSITKKEYFQTETILLNYNSKIEIKFYY